MMAYHLVSTAQLGWLALWVMAIFGGVYEWEYYPFLIATAAMLFAMNVLWWATGHRMVRPVSAHHAPEVPAQQQESGGMSAATTSPEKVFQWWFSSFLKEDINGKVGANEAYENYAANCRANLIQPENSATFGKWLTDIAENSGGRIKKVKSSGIFYHGLSLIGEGEHGVVAMSEVVPA